MLDGDLVHGVVKPLRRWWSLGIDISRPVRGSRLILLGIGVLLNVMAALYGLIADPDDVPTFFLAVFILNYLIYAIHYVIMKYRNKERLAWLSLVRTCVRAGTPRRPVA